MENLMNLKKTIDDLFQLKFDKTSKTIILFLYAVIMILSISNQIDMILFLVLFAILPISIYAYVKYIFPPQNNKKKPK